MSVALIHPRLTAANAQFFPLLATIQVKAVTSDPYGQDIETWPNVAELAEIPAAKAPLTAIERQAAGYTATDQAWHVLLAGAYPAITTRHRLSIDGVIYDIDAVEIDQTGSLTRLRVRQITT